MKKIILALVLVLASASGAYAADLIRTYVADGVVGKEDADTYVSALIFTCNSEVDNANGLEVTMDNCYGVLRNGDSTSDPVVLHFQTSVTFPTLVLNYKEIFGDYVFFTDGVYYDEVTGSTSLSIGFKQ
jgi:hypothetical protein